MSIISPRADDGNFHAAFLQLLKGKDVQLRPDSMVLVFGMDSQQLDFPNFAAVIEFIGHKANNYSIHLGNPGLTVIHGGTQRVGKRWVTNGGRVLNLATKASDLEAARALIETALPVVSWPGMQFRRDIGLRALKHAQAGKGVLDAW